MSCAVNPSSISTSAAPAHPVRRALWKAAGLCSAVLIVFIASDINARVRDPSPKLALGHDLLPSYAAAVAVRQGQPRDMYDKAAMTSIEHRIIEQANLDIDGRFGPWLNPPFYAWFFVPLATLPYRTAAAVFLAFNLILFGITLRLLARVLATPGGLPHADAPPLDWRTTALLPILVLLPLPFWQVIGHQQNTFISLLLLVGTVMCWRSDKRFAAGAIAGLLFFKPQLGAVLACVMIMDLGWRAMCGVAFTGIALFLVTVLTLPGCLADFLHRLPPILHWLQMESPYNWGRQVTFQSFWRLIIQGHVRGETVALARRLTWLSCGAIAFALFGACLRFRKGSRDAVMRDRLIAAAVASMPVLMPYYMDYDLLLLAAAAVLLAAEWIWRPELIRRADYWLLGAWIAFFLESHFNPGIAGHCRFNPAVPLLLAISILHIVRCYRQGHRGTLPVDAPAFDG